MSLVINHNLMAMNAAGNLQMSYGKLGVSTRRLSSGLRVGTSADDAAGMAIRELMRADIAATNQGVRNANDAISLTQTADGALQTIDDKLIRMKELAEQAATGTYNSTQRAIIDSEYQAMASEINRIASATDFNGINLLDGTLSGAANPLTINFGTGAHGSNDYYSIQIGCCTASALGLGASAGSSGTAAQAEAQYVAQNGLTFMAMHSVSWFASYNNAPASVQNQFNATDVVAWYTDGGGDSYFFPTDTSGKLHLMHGSPGVPFISDTVIFPPSAGAVGSISTQQLAQMALNAINTAITSKDNIRANLGAMQNRLSATVENLQTTAENLQSSESRISDVDVATEMTTFTRNQILTQSAVAMLSQANSLPKMALQLIQ